MEIIVKKKSKALDNPVVAVFLQGTLNFYTYTVHRSLIKTCFFFKNLNYMKI